MRKIAPILMLSILLLLLAPSSIVNAKEDYLEDLSILVYIHEDGSATIAERRIAYLTEGTENFDVIENLGKSTITDFFVQENNLRYEYVADWDSDASQEEKTFKNGIIETKNGYELVWGIGEYGKHEYIIVYTVTDFIKQLKDKQILFWRFVNDKMNIPPENVWIQIETSRPITSDSEKIWAFGFEGDIQFEDGMVVATSDQPFEENNYATVLIQFPQDTFKTNEILDKSFAEIQEDAFEGSDYGKKTGLRFVQDVLPYIVIAIILLAPLIIAYIFRFKALFKPNKKFKNIYKKYEGTYYRKIPYEGHFIDLFFLLRNEKLATYHTIVMAFLLKWLQEDKIKLHTELSTKWLKKNRMSISFHPTNDIDNEYERRLFDLFVQLKGSNERLRLNDSSVWTTKRQKEFGKWIKDIYEDTRDQLVEDGYLKKEINEAFSGPIKEYNVTESGANLREKLFKFMNYMTDYSLVHEHEAQNVKIWNDFMIWSALLGLTDVVIEQFEKIYPDSMPYLLYDKDTIASLDNFTRHTLTSNYGSILGGSGGGGATSVGGGGGSFGGGSGGGTR